jgi:hypothetical protein
VLVRVAVSKGHFGFSKKLENHEHALALYFMHYNFCRIHQSLRVTPAMEAGISDHILYENGALLSFAPSSQSHNRYLAGTSPILTPIYLPNGIGS